MSDTYFEFGKMVDIASLTSDQAIAFFGAPVYEAWRQSIGQSAPWERTPTKIRIKSVNRSTRTIEVETE